MNEDDETIWADSSSRPPLTCPPIHINCTEQYAYGDEGSMSDDASRLGLRLAAEPSETSFSQRIRNRTRRGIVWQAATPMTPYTH
jgi:hypothetical protein